MLAEFGTFPNMGPIGSICALLLSATIFSQVQSSEKIDFKSIFHTPQQRKYDDFEILERSSFEPDDPPMEPTHRCITEKPKAIANAQVLVNFDSHKKTPCDRMKQHPLVYLLPQVQHDAFYPPVHYHTPQCLQFPGCCYPSSCAAHVVSLPCPKLPAKVSKSCIFNLKHEIETLVDPNEMYGLTMPELSLQKSQGAIPMGLGVVEVPHCKSPIKDDEELILVGLNKQIEDEEAKIEEPVEQLILVEPPKPKEHFQQITNAPSKDNEELILVGINNKPKGDEARIEGFKQIPSEELILVGPAEDEPKIEGFELIANTPSKDEISNASFEGNEEQLISAGPAEFEGFEQISNTPSKDEEEIILVSPASSKPLSDASGKDNEEIILVEPVVSKIEGFEKIPAPKKTPISREAQKRILCTIENLVNHLVYDDVNGMQPCEKLRIAEVLTQILINLKNERGPSAVNEEGLKVFFDFIKKVQDEYSVIKVASRTATPISSLPISEEISNPATLLTQLQSRLLDAKETATPEKDEEYASAYTQLLLSYLQTLQVENDEEEKPVEDAATSSLAGSPVIVAPREVNGEEIRKEILDEVQLPLLNQYVVQLNSDRENEKPLSNEDVLNFWVNSALQMPRPSQKKKDVQLNSEWKKVPNTKGEETQEEINTYKHILESKPAEEKVAGDKIKEEIISVKPSAPGDPEPKEAKQEGNDHSADLAMLLQYLNLLNPSVAPVEAGVKPKEVNTSLLRPNVKVEAAGKGKEENCTADETPNTQTPKQTDIIKVENPLKDNEHVQKEEEFERVDEPDLPLAKYQDVVELTKLVQTEPPKQPEDIIRVVKQNQQENKIMRIFDHRGPELKKDIDINTFKEVKEHEQAHGAIIKTNAIIKQTKPSSHEIIAVKPEAQGHIIKVGGGGGIKPAVLNLALMKLKRDGNVDGVEEIIKLPLIREEPAEEITKVEKEQGGDEIIKAKEEVVKAEPGGDEIIKAKEEVVKAEPPKQGQVDIVKVSDLKPLNKKEDQSLEQLIRVDGLKKKTPEIVRVEKPEPNLTKEEEALDKFEEIGKAHREEHIIEIGKEKERATDGELLEPDALPTLKEYLEFLKAKQGDGSIPQIAFNKYLEFLKAKPADLSLVEFMKTKEGRSLPLIAEYLEFVKAKEASSSSKYVEFMKQEDEEKLKKYLGFKDVASLNAFLEFLRTKRASLKGLGLTEVIEFMKAEHIQKEEALHKYLNFIGLASPDEFIEFLKAQGPGKYLSFQEVPSLDVYVEFLKAKGGHHSLDKYVEFLKGKCGHHSLDEYIGFLKEKGDHNSLGKYIEFLKQKVDDHLSLDKYIEFLQEKGDRHCLDKYIEFLKAKTGHQETPSLPEYIEFTKARQEEETPQRYLNFKHLSLSAPSLNKYIEFVKSKQEPKDPSPAEYLEFAKAPSKLPFLDEYVEFLKTKHSNFSPSGYLEFVKAKSPEEYLNFKKLLSSDDYVGFVKANLPLEKFLSFKKLLSPEEFVEFTKVNKSLPEYIEFMKAKQTPICQKETAPQDKKKYVEFMEAKPESENLKDLTLEDISDMCKIMDNLEYIKLKLDGLEKAKTCQCEPDLGKLETPSGYEILTPNSYKCFHGKQDLARKIFPHDIDDLSRQKKGGPVFDLILPEQNIVAILHPQMAPSSSRNTCACGRTIENGRCPSCAPYIKEFNE